jgi:hypothetical protein
VLPVCRHHRGEVKAEVWIPNSIGRGRGNYDSNT